MPADHSLVTRQVSDTSISPPIFVQPNINMAAVPCGFYDLASKGLISQALLQCINTLRSLTTEASKSSEATIHDVLMFSDRRAQVEYSLEKVREAPDRSAGQLEQCCCLAILHYDHTALRSMPPGSATQIDLSNELITALNKTNLSSHWDGEYMALLWVLFIGYASTLTASDWFATLVQSIVSYIEPAIGFQNMKSILSCFIYSERVYGKKYEDLWSLLVERH